MLFVGTHWHPNDNGTLVHQDEKLALIADVQAREIAYEVPVHEREVPIFFTGVMCDYSGDFVLDQDDLDIITRAAPFDGQRGYNWYLDITQDGHVTTADVSEVLLLLGTQYGDANLDGVVGIDDAIVIGYYWGPTDGGWACGDFDGNGVVNNDDADYVQNNWNE